METGASGLLQHRLMKQLKEGTIICSMHRYLVEVYGHGAVAHLRRFVVVVPHSREGDAAASGAHRHSQSVPGGSVVGVESQTTKHFPSSTMGSVSFWPRTSRGPIRQRRANRVPLILLDQYLKYLLRPLAVSLLASAALSAGPEQMQKYPAVTPCEQGPCQ